MPGSVLLAVTWYLSLCPVCFSFWVILLCYTLCKWVTAGSVPAHAPLLPLLLLLLPAPPVPSLGFLAPLCLPSFRPPPRGTPPRTSPLLALRFPPLYLCGGPCPSQTCCVVPGYLCVSVGYQGIQDTWPLSSEGPSFKWSGHVMPKQIHKWDSSCKWWYVPWRRKTGCCQGDTGGRESLF